MPVNGLVHKRPRFLLTDSFEHAHLPRDARAGGAGGGVLAALGATDAAGARAPRFDFITFFSVLKPAIAHRFDAAFELVAECLAPGGLVVIVGDWPSPWDTTGRKGARAGSALECRKFRLHDDARSIWSNWGDAWLCARAAEAAGVLGEFELRGVASQISAEDRFSRSQFDA